MTATKFKNSPNTINLTVDQPVELTITNAG